MREESDLIHELNIAGLKLPNNIFLAPMAGYTNYPFRSMCLGLGAGLAFTEMVSAKGLAYGNEETKKLLYCRDEPVKAAQLFGSDPAILRAACESEDLAPFDLIDLNMGCPMPKIVKNGEGSALMEHPKLAEEVIKSCAKSGKRISVKFRTGIQEGDQMAVEFAKLCEGAGACMISIHGRAREKIYSGPVDFEQIARAKAAVGIPVIGNGGIWNEKDLQKMWSRTGVDGVMIGRAALYHPQIFSDLTGNFAPSMSELFFKELEETKRLYGERFACVFMRKMAAFYLKGRTGAAAMKRELFSAETTEAVESLARQFFSDESESAAL